MCNFDPHEDPLLFAAARAEAKGLLGQMVTLLPLAGREEEPAHLRGFYTDDHYCPCAVIAHSATASFCVLVHVSRIKELGMTR